MANKTIHDLPLADELFRSDEFEIVHDPAGTPVSERATAALFGFGEATIEVFLLDGDTSLAVADNIGKFFFWVPEDLDGWNLTGAHACVSTVSSSGTPTLRVYNTTDSVSMLSTLITIDASEKTSYTAATQPVVDTTHDDVAKGDQIQFDCTVTGTGTKGLAILLTFQKPEA